MDAIYDREYGNSAFLTFRTMLKKTPEEWRQFAASDLGSATGEQDNFPGAVSSVYDSSDYVNTYSLVKNSAHRLPGDLFKRSIMAFCLVSTLKQTHFKAEVLTPEFESWLGGVVLRHLQNYPCNAHTVDEMVIHDPRDMTKSKDFELAAAAYPTLSILNHSCDPSVTRVHFGDATVVFAVRSVKQGDEIFCNYGAHYAVMSKADRQATLKRQYFFECMCVPCKRNWPLFSVLADRSEKFRCPKCRFEKFPRKTPRCISCGEDLKLLWDTFEVMQANHADSYDKVVGGSTSDECLKFSVDYLAFLEDVVVRPSAAFNDCQETLKQCMLGRGNRRIVLP
jgi:hypothetical protein